MSRMMRGIVTMLCLLMAGAPGALAQDLYPRHMDANTQKAIKAGLDYLARIQTPDGNYNSGASDTTGYPTSMAALSGMAFLSNGNTPSRGIYADNVKRTTTYLLSLSRPSGIITDIAESSARPMHGHGFALLYLASVYGMETEPRTREALKKAITEGIVLTSRAQSNLGGWMYMPGQGDEGSVTVTQMQALRASSNAGFTVPKATVEGAIKYLERCRAPGGGIIYSASSGGPARLPISAAAIATLYNAGEYDSKLADECMTYVWAQFQAKKTVFSKGGGHDYYCHLYAAQAFYQAGNKYWDEYFPSARDQLLKLQRPDGSWTGEVGPVYATSIALIILQLPYKFVPIYQR